MDITLMFCPYCGGELGPKDDSGFLCKSCGKNIYSDRQSITNFIPDGDPGIRFNDVIEAIEGDNTKKALDIADELVENLGEDNADVFFLRGIVYAYLGEDGKASIDWKKGLEMLTSNQNLDAYVCSMSKVISDMMYAKEKEYIDFDPIRYIDKLCDEIYEDTKESCKALVYYSVYKNYVNLMDKLQEDGEEVFRDVIPLLFRRIVEYQRNMLCLKRIIDAYLSSMDYNPDTYEDDDMCELHVYELISLDLGKYTANMTDSDMKCIMEHWDDNALKSNEADLEALLPATKGSVIGKLLSRKNATDECPNEPDAVDLYVRRCLLLCDSDSDESAVVE